MRKIIYKGEFEHLCHQLNVKDSEKMELLSIFQNTPYSIKEYYELRPEFLTYKAIKSKFESVLGAIEKESIIKQIFTIWSDLDDLPDELLQEIKLKKVAVFVGAGMSKLISANYPLWAELADSAINFLQHKGKINFQERERLKKEIPDPKQKLSIFEKYLDEDDIKGKDSAVFAEFIQDQLKNKESSGKQMPINPYQLLCSESFDFIKVTSNLDLEFVTALKDRLESQEVSLNPNGMEPQSPTLVQRNVFEYIGGTNIELEFSKNKVYMIHGNVEEPASVILTTEDYINEYYSDRGTIRDFLSKLFNEYTVLFISYGLAEFPILERIFSPDKNNKLSTVANGKRHFILLPTYSTDISYFKVQSTYFDKLGITAIPYYLDTDGYNRICYVLENWKKTIERETIDNLDVVNSFLESGIQIEEVVKIIKQDERSFNHLFLNIKGVGSWDNFKSEGLFNAEKFFVSAEYKKDHDYFLYTPVAYFERISEALKDGAIETSRFAKELVSIITQVSCLAKKEQQKLSLRNRYLFINILANLPCDYVTPDFIENHLALWINNEESLEYLEHPIYTGLLKNLINSDNSCDWQKAERLFEILIIETYKSKDISKHYLTDAFVDGTIDKNIYKTIAAKFSKKFIDFLIETIEDFIIKKHFYTVSYVLNGDDKSIQLRYLGSKVFEEKLEDGSGGLHVSFDPKGKGEDFALAVVKAVEKENFTKVTNLWENFSDFGKQFYESGYSDRDYSIFNEEQSYHHHEKSLVTILKQVLNVRSFSDEEQVRLLMSDFLNEQHEFFIQLSLFLIDANWRLKDFVGPILNCNPGIIYEERILKNDLREFLKRNVMKLTKEQKELLDEKIEKGPYMYINSYNNESVKRWKLSWYNAVKSDKFFENRFDSLSEGKHYNPEELDDSGRIRWYHEFSPKSPDDLNKMENDEIIEYIQTFVPDSETKWDRGSIRQLASTIAQLQMLNSSKFYKLVEGEFIFPYVYADRLINAFEENWKNNKTRSSIDLERIFSFIERYMEYVVFEDENLVVQTESYIDSKILAGSIASFISHGNDSEDREFPAVYLERCERIILTLTENIAKYIEPRINKVIDDSGMREYTLNHAINSNQGKILMAHFYITRRIALNKKKENNTFKDEFKESLLKCFDSKIRDSFIVFGSFVTSYAYFNEEFTLKLIDEFIQLDDENWKSFFGGWLFWDFRGYSPQLHERLKPHYIKAIDMNFDVKGVQESSGLTRKITIAYYWGYEGMNGKLINAFLKNSPIDRLERLVQILRYDNKELKKNQEIRMRVIPLWDKIIETIKLRVDDGKQKVIAETLSLAKYVDTLDKETCNRFLFVLESDCERIYLRDFLKELKRILGNSNALQTAEYTCLLIDIIVNKYYPRPDKDLQSLLNDLFERKHPELDNRLRSICNRIIEVNDGYISWPLDLVKKYLDKM